MSELLDWAIALGACIPRMLTTIPTETIINMAKARMCRLIIFSPKLSQQMPESIPLPPSPGNHLARVRKTNTVEDYYDKLIWRRKAIFLGGFFSKVVASTCFHPSNVRQAAIPG
jgi:hypothetical protein